MSVSDTNPAKYAQAITPGDTGSGPANGEVEFCRGIYVGSAGDLEVILEGETLPVIFSGVLAGSLLPLRANRIMSSNTTASNIIVVW